MRAREALSFSAVVLLGLGACYDTPTGDEPCAITCVSECPGDLTCTNGFCVGPGEECTAAFTSITMGAGVACALDELSDLWCWGNNDRHQIDPGDTPVFPVAHRIAGRKYQQVSAGRGHICAISDGELYCWGANDRGQISSSLVGDVAEPTRIETTGGPASWRSVSAGFQTTCAIAEDGRLFCWGRNNNGQVGNGNFVDAGAPTPVRTELADWTIVAQGGGQSNGQHACAVSASAGLHCWGSNTYAQLADETIANSPVPIPVALPDVTSIALAAYSSCAISAGDPYCWGYDSGGSLGDPTVVVPTGQNVATPTLASSLRGNWTELGASEQIVCGTRDGAIYCWGQTRTGAGIGSATWQPGLRSFTEVAASGAERLAVGFSEWLDVFGGVALDVESACFLEAGAIKCWGDNRFGQLGQGAASETAVPLEITGEKTWTALATGVRHACGVDSDGQLSCWGSTLSGAVDGTPGGRVETPCTRAPCDIGTPQLIGPANGIAIGTHHTCGLTGDQISCWGDNSFNQHGMPVPTPAPSTIPGSFSEIFDLHANATCGRTSTDITCWGDSLAPTPVPELATMTSIASGGILAVGSFGIACFLDNAGTLFCGGDNSRGQYGNGDCSAGCVCGNLVCDGAETSATCPTDCGTGGFSKLSRGYLAFSIGWDLDNTGPPSCGVRSDGSVECWGRNPGGMFSQEIDPNTSAIVAFIDTPVPIKTLSGCTDVSVGQRHACAICNDDILCWGDHTHGAVGSGSQTFELITEPRSIATKLDDGDRWVQLTSGAGFSCARSEAGRGFCWGSNQHGALGLGAAASTIPVVVQTE
jgi:alpha-tubulin suppressor-like RCC1 family protein